MSISAELIMREDNEQHLSEPNGCQNESNGTADVEPFCEESFSLAFCAAACSDDPELLNTISTLFALYPAQAWATVEKICQEKAAEATRATQSGDYAAAAAAIDQHHALAMVYSKLIAARIERLNSQL